MSKTFETDPPNADEESESRVSPVGEDVADDDKVGYRRPPKSFQFKKGQSGNPRGSSRKVQRRLRRQGLPLDDLILENSQTLLRIREGNRTSSINVKEGMIRKLSALALSGNRLALTASLKMIQAAEKNTLAEALDHYATYRDYQDQYDARAKACRDRDLPPPLPHPDDLHFDYNTYKLKITGPINHEQLHRLEKILEARELFLKMIEEQRADAEECAQQGCPYSPKDLEILSLLENYLRFFDNELEKRDWLPRVAGRKET
jgi:hypothetical protein